MTAATVAPVSGNGFAVLLVMVILIGAIACVVLWVHEQRSDKQGDTLAEHTEQLATLAGRIGSIADFLEVDINDPVEDDGPGREDDAKTDEFPVAPATVPDGMPLAVQSALIERPSPVPRDLSGEFPHPVDSDERKAQNAADIDEALKRFDFSGRDR